MKTINPTLFLEQVGLGAEVQPGLSAYQVGIQVGRFQYLCELEDFDSAQKQQFEQLYRTGAIRFGYPGDFRVLPYFFQCAHRTKTTRLFSHRWMDNLL